MRKILIILLFASFLIAQDSAKTAIKKGHEHVYNLIVEYAKYKYDDKDFQTAEVNRQMEALIHVIDEVMELKAKNNYQRANVFEELIKKHAISIEDSTGVITYFEWVSVWQDYQHIPRKQQ